MVDNCFTNSPDEVWTNETSTIYIQQLRNFSFKLPKTDIQQPTIFLFQIVLYWRGKKKKKKEYTGHNVLFSWNAITTADYDIGYKS